MRFLSEEDVERGNSQSFLTRLESRGRGHRSTGNVSPEIRSIIGALAQNEDVNQGEIAEAFGVSQSLVSQAKHGNTSAGTAVDDLKASNASAREKIESVALKKLLSVLQGIDDDDIAELSAEKASRVAANLAGVSERLKGNQNTMISNMQVIVHAAPVKEVAHYDVIEIEGTEVKD
jgi:predicted transcriptional regulator